MFVDFKYMQHFLQLNSKKALVKIHRQIYLNTHCSDVLCYQRDKIDHAKLMKTHPPTLLAQDQKNTWGKEIFQSYGMKWFLRSKISVNLK